MYNQEHLFMSERILTQKFEEPIPPEIIRSIFDGSTFDIDGTLIDTRTPATNKANEILRTNHTPDEIRSFKAIYYWAVDAGMDHDEAVKLDHDIWSDQEVLFKGVPVPGALELYFKFYTYGCLNPIITSRPADHKEMTIEWFRIHAPFVKPKDIYLQQDGAMAGEVFKTVMIQKLSKVNGVVRPIHFEDLVHHARMVLDYTNSSVILFSNSDELDSEYSDRLSRFGSENGHRPNMVALYKNIFGREPTNFTTSHNLDNLTVPL